VIRLWHLQPYLQRIPEEEKTNGYVGTSHRQTDNSHSPARAGDIYTLQLATWLSVQPQKRYPISDHHSNKVHWSVRRLAAKV
jgi:hypothetical protein